MAEESKFEFTYLPSSRVGSFDKDTEELFQKWYVELVLYAYSLVIIL